MVELIDRVELNVDQFGQISLPKGLQEKLEPGVALVVETRHNGAIGLRIQRVSLTQTINEETLSSPQLVNKDGILVVRGEVPADFDWDMFLQEREAPLHTTEPAA
ncbi:hypothetical protein BH10CHL1_BH10CHL1_45210 [soil metagenome]